MQGLDARLVGGRGFPRHRGRLAGRPCRDDEVVVCNGAGVAGRREVDCFGGRVQACSFAEDEFYAVGGVLREPGLDGLQDLLIFEDAGDDGADGRNVPVEMGVL